MSGIELDKLEHIIASMLDHPSVFMGGPSRQSRRTARRIVDEVVAWNTRSQSERERRLEEALKEIVAFVSVMCGRGPDAVIPETISTPLGVPVKIGEIMRDARSALNPTPEGGGSNG